MNVLKIFLLLCILLLSFVIFVNPLNFSDNIESIDLLGSGEATEKISENNPLPKFNIFTEHKEMPIIKLGLNKSFGAMFRLHTENKKPALIGAVIIQPNEDSEKNCHNLINNKANFIWRWVAKYYPVPQSMDEDGAAIAKLWRFDNEQELIPGIWTIRFCGKKNNQFTVLHDFKFQMVE